MTDEYRDFLSARRNIQINDIRERFPHLDIDSLNVQVRELDLYVYLDNQNVIVHDGLHIIQIKTDLGFALESLSKLMSEYVIVEQDWRTYIIEKPIGSKARVTSYYSDNGQRMASKRHFRKVMKDKKGTFIKLTEKAYFSFIEGKEEGIIDVKH